MPGFSPLGSSPLGTPPPAGAAYSISMGWIEGDDTAALAAIVAPPSGAFAAIGWVEGDDTITLAAVVTPAGTTAVAIGWTEGNDTATIAAINTSPGETVEPITLAQAKDHLRVVGADEDAYITGLIVAAREAAEGRTQRALVPRNEVLALECWPAAIRLPWPPLQAVTGIEYDDQDDTEQTVPDSGYRVNSYVEPARITRKGTEGWPTVLAGDAVIRVRYRTGYASPSSVPASLRQWMLLAIGTMYENRESAAPCAQIYELPEDFMSLLLQPHVVYM